MTTALVRFGAIAVFVLALTATGWPAAQSRSGVERGRDVVQYCAPADSWDVARLFCGRVEG